ncbi:hypothetical protein BDR07DRAFT_1429903, partial [Suillus spraguei]
MHLARPRVVAVTELHRLFTHIIHIVRAVYPLRPDHGFKPRMFQTIHMLCNSRYSNRHSFNFRTLLSLHSILPCQLQRHFLLLSHNHSVYPYPRTLTVLQY